MQIFDNYVSDTDALSNTALLDLYNSGFSVSYLAKILSSGVLGIKKNRKLVPTRWALVACYSNISKHFIQIIILFSMDIFILEQALVIRLVDIFTILEVQLL